ncbi:leucine-rich repeat domain-containing protein [Mesoaciditoga lauensis]|uniref:leucine-rich repeat domain-containing protein n=1 Tax=Mesoaciditoga lauensis TaxID=1495039 RepID=UPI00056A1005|nr:leucine-rich repeat domain-containing protein [Mesoaciditoga lauensis]
MRKRKLALLVGVAIISFILSSCFLLTYNVSGYVKDSSGNPLIGVTISFSNGSSDTTTNSNGYWSKEGLMGEVTITPSLVGYTFNPPSMVVSSSKSDVNFAGTKETDLSGKIVDLNLLRVIREAINKPTGPIYESDLLQITTLENFNQFSSKRISDLEGIQYCLNLKTLNLYRNNISTISQLASLTHLEILELCCNQVSDITPLQNLTSLQYLGFSYNQVSNITALHNLSGLKCLNMSYNKITDLGLIQNLTNLEKVYIGGNMIPKSNWAFVKNWTWLKILGLRDMNLENQDITFLSNFSNLQVLWIDHNQISDISPLKNLTSLEDLQLDDNKISDASPLQNLVNLVNVWFESNQIVDTKPFQNLVNIKQLVLEDNKIEDISPLVKNSGLNSYDFLDIRYNFLDLTPGSVDMNNIQTLLNRNVAVSYNPQNQ